MTREELTAIVKRSNSTTLVACRFRDALGLPHPKAKTKVRNRSRGNRYKGARKLMQQRYGVDLRNV